MFLSLSLFLKPGTISFPEQNASKHSRREEILLFDEDRDGGRYFFVAFESFLQELKNIVKNENQS
jgi:hypothetical protein